MNPLPQSPAAFSKLLCCNDLCVTCNATDFTNPALLFKADCYKTATSFSVERFCFSCGSTTTCILNIHGNLLPHPFMRLFWCND